MLFLVVTVTFIISFMGSIVNAESPEWTIEPIEKKDNTLTVTCIGIGPDLYLARESALNDCKSTASSYLYSDFNQKVTIIETETEVSLHKTTSSSSKIKNLECVPVKEKIEEKERQFKIYLQCRFDLLKIIKADLPDKTNNEDENPAFDLKNLSEPEVKETKFSFGQFLKSKKRQLKITTIPQCSDILIEGPHARSIKCTGNPFGVLLFPQDSRITFRAKGYKPKTLDLKSSKEIYETVDILFEE